MISRSLSQELQVVTSKSSTETFKKRVFIEEEAAQINMRFLAGPHTAWMIYEQFKTGDTANTLPDFSEIIEVKLRSDSMQAFTTKCDEVLIR